MRDKARQIGAYRLIGKTMFLMPEDVEALLEASRPKGRGPATPASRWTDADTDKLRNKLTVKKSLQEQLQGSPLSLLNHQ